MTASLILIVLSGHAMDTLFNNSVITSDFNLISSIPEGLSDQSLQLRAKRYNYTYTPGIGAHKVHTQAATWNKARRTCEEEGGHLAIINSIAESRVIGQLLKNSGEHFGSEYRDSAHIGVHELYGANDWVTIHGDALATAGFDIWLPGEPSHDGNNAHCASILNDKLNDNRCDQRLGFICELSQSVNSYSSVRNEPADQDIQLRAARYNYTYTLGIGAHKVHTQAVTWNVARRTCEEEGGHLAIINSIAESRVIGQLQRNSGEYVGSEWPDSVHLGAHDLYGANDWVTIHGEPLATAGFDIWLPGEPSHDGNNAHCVSLLHDKLNDHICNQRLGFVCELPYAFNPVLPSV